MTGKVYLTGAGPGDIELLTIKALRIIKKADVIIYDKLANPDILKEAKNGCNFIYVGKENKHHIMPQNEINEIIYQNALKYEHVVRLKGGDPFVFGRGGEEGIFLREKEIEFELIPGISSAIAVPEYAGIPVTHRGIATSFRVVTAHKSSDKTKNELSFEDYKNDDTIIFLMGLNQLKKIATKLIEIGKPKNHPIAVISKGTTKDEKVVIGTLENIYELAKDLKTPVLIVVGEVVNLRKKLNWMKKSC